MFTEIISVLVSVLLGSTGISLFQNVIVNKVNKRENEEICKDINKVMDITSDDDIEKLMLMNVKELREYYAISKNHANKAFVSALTACVFGFIIYIAGIVLLVVTKQDVIFYTTIAGSVVEVISGLFFWLYKTSLSQLNLYHDRLGSTEKYLIAMQLTEKVSNEKKDEFYRHIMECVLIDNRIREQRKESSN